MNATAVVEPPRTISVSHFVKGKTIEGSDVEFAGLGGMRLTGPQLDMDALTWLRHEPCPAHDLPLREIVDLLVATGDRLRSDPDGLLAEAFERMLLASPLERGVLKRAYGDLPRLFEKELLEFTVEHEIGGSDVLDKWRDVELPSGQHARYRAFPPRLIHILAGNVPGVAALSIARGALTKGVHLLKLPSNDLFTATAILRTMAAIAPDHPVVRSFTAVYWRGGDVRAEGMLFRPQFFDKLVAWGGDAALKSAKNYIGPGFELVAFDPKTSISMIGHEAFESDAITAQVAALGGADSTCYNQMACNSSRVQFVEGSIEEIDRYCERLQRELGLERRTASEIGPRIPSDVREEVDALRSMEPEYRVWGDYSGRGIVIRSEEPVDFYPDNKIVNVVPVRTLKEAVKFVNVATQTVGVYPAERRKELRDFLISAGAQRVVTLGKAGEGGPGLPHDGFFPLQRLVRWASDED